MQKAFFIVLLMGLGLQTFTGIAAPALKEVAALLPHITTAQQVDQQLGEPDRIDKGLGQMIWYYTGEGFSLAVMWDMQTSKVTKYSFSCKAGKENEWMAEAAKHFVTGQTTVEDIIKQLGTPNDISADRGKYQVQYVYNNNIVHLRFVNSKLMDYTVSAK